MFLGINGDCVIFQKFNGKLEGWNQSENLF
jgi:hypothetical protein